MPAKSRTRRSSGTAFAVAPARPNPSRYHRTPFSLTETQGMLAYALLRPKIDYWTSFGPTEAMDAGKVNAFAALDLGNICSLFDLRQDSHFSFINPYSGVPITPLFSAPVASETDGIIARIGQTTNLEDEEEQAPLPAVIEQASGSIRETSGLMRTSMPEGAFSTFYGEINITWRNGNHIVRLACFPASPSILQFGNLSQPLGSYQSQQSMFRSRARGPQKSTQDRTARHKSDDKE